MDFRATRHGPVHQSTLAMPLFLDRAETVLVELIKEHASHIKGSGNCILESSIDRNTP